MAPTRTPVSKDSRGLARAIRALDEARQHPQQLPFVFPVVSLKVAAPWALGPGTLDPPMALLRELRQHPARRSARAARAKLHQYALAQADEWKEMTTIRVVATSQTEAADRAIAILRILRLYQRIRYPYVSLRHQAFGLPGELFAVQRKAVLLGRSPTVHWTRLGNLGDWSFTDADQAQLPHDQRVSYLLRALNTRPGQRLALDRRLLLGLELLDIAWLSHDSRIKTLHLAMALEVLLGMSYEGGETLSISRRVAFLTCQAHCGREGVPACRYLYPFANREEVAAFINERQLAGLPGLCSAFLEVAFHLFTDRNRVVHRGASGISDEAVSQHHSTVETALLAFVDWAYSHPGAKFRSLDSEIAKTQQRGSPYLRQDYRGP
jgi:hypothetical protein